MSGLIIFLAGYYTGIAVVLAGWVITIELDHRRKS